MSTWIFQGNPERFNVNDYLLDNDEIWWSIRQKHLADKIAIGDEVFVWRSDGGERGSGGIVARTIALTTPEQYVNDEEAANYWYEDVSNDSYLAVKLQVIEVDVIEGLNRLELAEHPKLQNLMILRLKQNTNYLVEDGLASYLRQLWYGKYLPLDKDSEIDNGIVKTRFKVVTELNQVMNNIKQFNEDLAEYEGLRKQLKQFQQWYYVLEFDLFAPSKFIGYQEMKGHMYTDKEAIIGLDGRETVNVLKEYFIPIDNEGLRKHLQNLFQGELRKAYEINVLKSEKQLIEQRFSEGYREVDKNQLIKDFHRAMLRIYDKSKAIGYTPSKFRQMVANEGGLQTAKKLIGSKQLSDGFAELAQLGRLDLTVEALVLKKENTILFTESELETARERLTQLGFFLEIEDDEHDDLLLIVEDDLEALRIEEGNGIEGAKKAYLVNKYERDSKNRKKAIKMHGLNCYACGFNFEEVYGERGKEFIEIHHIKPLSTLEKAIEINPETDLVPLCANCHRMVHRRKDNYLSIEELKELIQKHKS